jgi:hypothetical protein
MKSSRWWFILLIGLIALAGAVFGPQAADLVTLGSADTKETQPRLASRDGTGPAAERGAAQAFDYFPDHYVNRAK